VHCRLFVGPDVEHLALAGHITLRADEFGDFLAVYSGEEDHSAVCWLEFEGAEPPREESSPPFAPSPVNVGGKKRE
jgi:hypothetical protein